MHDFSYFSFVTRTICRRPSVILQLGYSLAKQAEVTLRGPNSSLWPAFMASIDCCGCSNYEAIHISC